VDAVANTGGTCGEFMPVINSEHSLLTSGFSCELAGYAFTSSFVGYHLHVVRNIARPSVATTMFGEYLKYCGEFHYFALIEILT
jgi:hypothetical protein